MSSGSVVRILALAGLCASLGGCGGLSVTQLTSADYDYARAPRAHSDAAPDASLFPPGDDDTTPSTVEGTALQCVPYAREHSGVNIHGDAYTWWDKAAGVYARGDTPIVGNVMVLNGYAGRHRAHVAVVRRIVNSRKILIDHANWLDDGAVYVNDPVIDVSDNNDWTAVKVWNIRSGSWGTKVYKVQGFISPNPANGSPLVASLETPSPADPIALQIAASNGDIDDSDDDR
jgi:hypothetical protein